VKQRRGRFKIISLYEETDHDHPDDNNDSAGDLEGSQVLLSQLKGPEGYRGKGYHKDGERYPSYHLSLSIKLNPVIYGRGMLQPHDLEKQCPDDPPFPSGYLHMKKLSHPFIGSEDDQDNQGKPGDLFLFLSEYGIGDVAAIKLSNGQEIQ